MAELAFPRIVIGIDPYFRDGVLEEQQDQRGHQRHTCDDVHHRFVGLLFLFFDGGYRPSRGHCDPGHSGRRRCLQLDGGFRQRRRTAGQGRGRRSQRNRRRGCRSTTGTRRSGRCGALGDRRGAHGRAGSRRHRSGAGHGRARCSGRGRRTGSASQPDGWSRGSRRRAGGAERNSRSRARRCSGSGRCDRRAGNRRTCRRSDRHRRGRDRRSICGLQRYADGFLFQRHARSLLFQGHARCQLRRVWIQFIVFAHSPGVFWISSFGSKSIACGRVKLPAEEKFYPRTHSLGSSVKTCSQERFPSAVRQITHLRNFP